MALLPTTKMLHVNCTLITWLNTWALEPVPPDGMVFQELAEVTVTMDMATMDVATDIKFKMTHDSIFLKIIIR